MIGYEGLVWVNDDKGRELVCTLDSVRPGVRRFDDLNEGERRSCRDVNEIVGTERWQTPLETLTKGPEPTGSGPFLC